MRTNYPNYEAVIVAAARTAVGRAKKGSLATVRPDEMASTVIRDLLKRAPALDPAEIDDLILGCAFPEGEQGMNLSRLIGLRAGLPEVVPAETITVTDRDGSEALYVMDADGSNPYRVTGSETRLGFPDWQPVPR